MSEENENVVVNENAQEEHFGNANLRQANRAQEDEFYTQMSDLEKELNYYRLLFKDKVILCNCDDPYESNFFKYFAINFNFLGLKKLIATCIDGSPIAGEQLSLFDFMEENDVKQKWIAYKIEINEVKDFNEDGAVDGDLYLLDSDGHPQVPYTRIIIKKREQ